MKILEVSEDQFVYFANKLTPNLRGVGLPCRAFVLWPVNTMVIVKGELDEIVELPPHYAKSEALSFNELQNFVRTGNIKGIVAPSQNLEDYKFIQVPGHIPAK